MTTGIVKAISSRLSITITIALLSIDPAFSDNNIDSVWDALIFNKTYCIGGEQYRFEHPEMRTPLFFSMPEWNNLAKNHNSELGQYLLNTLSDTVTTKIHACPFELATKGEMAVYALQQLTETNWYEFDTFREYAVMPVSDNQNLQRWL